MLKPEVTIVIHTRNEALHIKKCITSARFLTASIVLIDMQSTDDTVSIAKSAGAKVFSFPFTKYVEPAREFGISKADTEWVFLLDADERMTEALAQEINAIISKQTTFTHFRVPRKNMFGGKKWLRHGGWWPDHQLRLFRKDALITWPKEIHATPRFRGDCSLLNNPFEHHFHGSIEEMVEKTLVFEDIESELLFRAGRPVGTLTFFRKFLGELNRRLILRRAYLDGTIGIIEAFYQAYSKTITYLLLYEKYSRQKEESRAV